MPNPRSKINVLLLGLGGNVSQGILKALRYSLLPCDLIGACVSADAAGLFFCDKAYISPFANSPEFIPWLKRVCIEERISIILSGVEEVLTAIAPLKNILQQETGAIAIVSEPDQLAIGRDKLLTCEWLKKNDLPFPAYCASEDWTGVDKLAKRTGFRLIAKPRLGKGSQGIIRVRDKSVLESLKGLKDYVIEEEVGTPEKEYTVGCYQLKNGQIETIAMKRRLTAGTTSAAVICHEEKVLETARAICAKFSPMGPLNAQMRVNDHGEAVCFELNVRFSGTTPMRSHFGFEDVKAACLEYALDKNAQTCFHPRDGIAFRFWDEVYVEENSVKELKAKKVLASPGKFASLSPRLLPDV